MSLDCCSQTVAEIKWKIELQYKNGKAIIRELLLVVSELRSTEATSWFINSNTPLCHIYCSSNILYRLDFIVSPTGIYQNPTAQRLCMNFSRSPDSYREPKMKFCLVLLQNLFD